ncbi:NAD(P)/FAD-dependent oxidoreductase [Saccharophagus degradans]|uniref:HI0933-like protein n=1 Tax=Saccharophagus degradans (strain 2-40 / ATCC 43961 / DSM 17024) TaxID=203122 RepID=Q21K82_SACD2|nr:NAD(P)/FAD-dependent oxidoreductase [Saccharophagus degradans]ABD80897.1 HI0933-like protein [Saccharophagus degradans 2-40]
MKDLDCIVIGGGAAGLMCAATAGQRGKSVAVLDHANKVGKKILMSGGGRCNFTNYFVEPANYLSQNPHFCKSALSRYTQYDFIELVSRYNLEYHEKTLGQLFCDHKAKDILNILLAECELGGVEITTQCSIEKVEQLTGDTDYRFKLHTTMGAYRCKSLVVASGGLSIPTMGATGFGYDLAKQFGLRITAREASLVPFTFKGELLTLAQSLAGVALPVVISCNNQSFKEAMLFTHKGISGPAVLQISNYWYSGNNIEINFLPDIDLAEQIAQWQSEKSKSELTTLLSRLMPKRFVVAWLAAEHAKACGANSIANKNIADLSRSDIEIIAKLFHAWQCMPAGTEGYKTAEVTRGGVNTDDVSSKTFEAKKVPGLYFIGEVLDVTGWLGGFNFQWAWASGYCAAQHV